jgi:acyl transferase domain-containing protein
MQVFRRVGPNSLRPFVISERTGHMSRKTVLLFPGQGVYLPGPLSRLTSELPEVALTFAELDAVASAARLSSVSEAVAGAHAPDLVQVQRKQAL